LLGGQNAQLRGHWSWDDDTHEGWARGAIVTSGLRFKVPEDSQGSLWEDRVVLDEVFWKALRDHPVPVLEALAAATAAYPEARAASRLGARTVRSASRMSGRTGGAGHARTGRPRRNTSDLVRWVAPGTKPPEI